MYETIKEWCVNWLMGWRFLFLADVGFVNRSLAVAMGISLLLACV